jgi:hypothetical protein
MYLDQQQTEEIVTKVKDIGARWDTNYESVRMLSRVAFWGVIRALQSDINVSYSPHHASPH